MDGELSDKPGHIGNYRDYKEYLEALQAKGTNAPKESAAKQEMRKVTENKVAVKNRIEVFSLKKIDTIRGDTTNVKRTVSCKISERVTALESTDTQQKTKVKVADSALAPRAMAFGSVSAYKPPKTNMHSVTMKLKAVNAFKLKPKSNDEDDQVDQVEDTETGTESVPRVSFNDNSDGEGRKCSIGKYALTPMVSVDESRDEPENNAKDEKEDNEEVTETVEATKQDDEDSTDSGVLMRNKDSLDGLTADELTSEYQKIETEIQRLSQEIDKEELTLPADFHDTDEVDETKSSRSSKLSMPRDSQNSDVLKTLNIEVPTDDVYKEEVAVTLKEFDDKLGLLEKAQGPPPPPPILSGNIPTARLKSEIGERRNEPPACVQNAMMTKDKKPFTYTPGGIDLSEIKSPRMARRIERNANAPGVGELPPQQYQQGPQQNRPLPPSALAAMQPQLPIQVFPSGAPPPPPPPPVNAPPPPPPMQPMPMKPAVSNDGVFERPDMTRIIPENPMAMLRKTPKTERRTFLDELADMERKNTQQPNNYQQQQYSPPVNNQPPPRSPQPQYNQQPQYSPQPQYNQPQYSPQPQTPQSQASPQYYSPQPQQQQSPQFNRQPSYTTPAQPYSPQPYQQANSHPIAQMVHQPSMESNGPPSPPTKTSNVSIGSLYIPPINQHQQAQQQVQYQPASPKPQSPPTPPQRQPQSPQTPQSPIPKLNAAPKPWQNQQRREPELPEWAQRHQQSPPKEETVQSARMAQPPRVTPVQMQPPPSRPGVEMVFVTQPEVYQHPGPMAGPMPGQRWVPPQVQQHMQQQQQQHQQQMQQQHQQQMQMQMQRQQQQQYVQQEMKGTRIIPIQIEGQNSGPNSPATPDRNLNRQQSWTPTQSNSFKVIQKITNTENPNDEVDQPQVEYGPRTAQQFPADQMRKMNLNDSDRDFMNRVKQDYINKRDDEENPRYRGGHIPSRVFRYIDQSGVDQENYLHNEPDPRYRGAAISSKAFRMLQHLTDTPDHPAHSTPTVPQSPNQPRASNVHTIPIQLEGEPQQPYVHPSQQIVEEPRKYMGSSIPSKAFHMLQAMTNSPAADNIDKQTSEISDKNVAEINEPSSQTAQPTNSTTPSPYPMYGPNYYDPYWYDYYSYYYPNYAQTDGQTHAQTQAQTNESTQNWGYHYPSAAPTPTQELEGETQMCSSCRNTPVPFWNYYPNYYNHNQGYESDTGKSDSSSYRNTPSNFDYQYYWDPYYYSYYPPPPPPGYGYPPYPYPSDGYDGYCSMDEMNQIEQGNVNSNPQMHSLEAESTTQTSNNQQMTSNTEETTLPESKIVTEVQSIDDFCDDRSETTIIDDREHDMDADSESSSDEDDGEVKEIYRKSTSNVPMINQLVEHVQCIKLPSKTPIHMSDADIDTDTEVEDDDVDEEEETKEEHVKAILIKVDDEEDDDNDEDGESDNNEGDDGDIESYSETTENEYEQDDEQEDIASVYNDEDQMPHVLSVIYEESERSVSSRMERESSVASQNTIIADDDDQMDDDDIYEKEVIAKLPLLLTEINGKMEMTVGDLNVEESVHYESDQKLEEIEENRLNYESDATVIENEMVAIEPEHNPMIRSRSNSSHVESECEIHMDDDKNSVGSTDSEIESDITHLPGISKEDGSEIVKDQGHVGEEVDFWSQINTEEDVLPKRQVFVNKYRDSVYSVDEDDDVQETKAREEVFNTRTTFEEDAHSSKALIESTKDTNSITTWLEDNSVTNHIMNTHEEEILTLCEEESDDEIRTTAGKVRNTKEHTILSQKVDNIEVTVDVVSDTQQEQSTKVDIKVNDEQIEKLQVEECMFSNVVITKEEIRETLQAPKFDLGLDECFKNIQNHLKLTLDNLKYKKDEEVSLPEEDKHVYSLVEETQEELPVIKHELPIKVSSIPVEDNVSENKINVEVEKGQDIKEIQRKEDGNCSVISRNRSLSRSKSKESSPLQTNIIDDCEDTEVSDLNNNTQDFYVPTIKERIRALHNASRNSTPVKIKPTIEIPTLEVQDKDYLTPDLIVPKSPKTSTKSSIKSVEDNSEDEIDSGVTSDMSRHISDTESESIQEIRKIIKYQRAATHSRLYKLLQDECDEEEEQELLQKKRDSITRKESLSLPLKNISKPVNTSFTSGDESGFNSPASPITDKQVNELVSNLLKNKNVELKNVPMEMLQAAAFKILQEDKDCKDLSSSDEFNTFLSPLLLDGSATAAQTPQEFYTNNEYSQYYETWESAQQDEIPASKSFKLLQEASSQKIPNFTARCPVVNDKRKEKRLSNATPTPTFVSNSCTPVPDPSLETQEVASAS